MPIISRSIKSFPLDSRVRTDNRILDSNYVFDADEKLHLFPSIAMISSTLPSPYTASHD